MLQITNKKDPSIKFNTLYNLALYLYKQGENIVYCDIEALTKDINTETYYLLDECGNYVELMKEEWDIQINKLKENEE